MTRSRLFSLALVVVLLGGAVLVARHFGYLTPRIRIGVLLPLTGPDAAVGLGMRNSIQLAFDEAAQSGPIHHRRLEPVYFDEPPGAAEGAAAGGQMAADPTILAAIPHYNEMAALETNSVYNTLGLGHIVPGVIHATITDENARSPERFRMVPSSRVEMRQAGRYVNETLGKRHVFVLYENTYWYQTLAMMFMEGLSHFDKEPPRQASFAPTDHDFKGLALVIKANASDYVVFSGAPTQAAEFVIALRDAGSDAVVQLAEKYPSDEFIALAKDKAEGTVVLFGALFPEYTPRGRAFLEAYKKAGFKEPPGPYGLFAYAAAQAMIMAVKRSTLDRKSVVLALKNGKFDGALGPFRFDQHGQSFNNQTAVYKVVGGRWQPILTSLMDDPEGEADEAKWVPFVAQ